MPRSRGRRRLPRQGRFSTKPVSSRLQRSSQPWPRRSPKPSKRENNNFEPRNPARSACPRCSPRRPLTDRRSPPDPPCPCASPRLEKFAQPSRPDGTRSSPRSGVCRGTFEPACSMSSFLRSPSGRYQPAVERQLLVHPRTGWRGRDLP